MSSLRAHFESRCAGLGDRARVDTERMSSAVLLRLRPRTSTAVGVVLYLTDYGLGTVALDDPGCVRAELGEDRDADIAAIDDFVDVAVEGRATAFHLGRGGCIETREGDRIRRCWNLAVPWPGWRRRAERVAYAPYS